MSVAIFARLTFSSLQQYSGQGSGMILIPNALSIWDPPLFTISNKHLMGGFFLLLCHSTKKGLPSCFFKLMANFQSSESLLRSLIGDGLDHNDPSKPSHRLTNGPEPLKTIESDGGNIKNHRKTIDGNGQTAQKTFNGDGLLKNH